MTLKNVAVNTNMLVIKKNILLVGSSCTEKKNLLCRKPITRLPISGQNIAGQESMTYPLLRHHKKQTGDRWTECCRTRIHNLPAVEASQKANR